MLSLTIFFNENIFSTAKALFQQRTSYKPYQWYWCDWCYCWLNLCMYEEEKYQRAKSDKYLVTKWRSEHVFVETTRRWSSFPEQTLPATCESKAPWGTRVQDKENKPQVRNTSSQVHAFCLTDFFLAPSVHSWWNSQHCWSRRNAW